MEEKKIMLKKNYTFAEIREHQNQTLTEKIRMAVAVLQKAEKLSKHNIAIAFSGGKDSQVVADLIERFLPEMHKKCFCLFGNTSVEFPESLKFARKYGKEHFGDRFYETELLELKERELRYDFAHQLIKQLEKENALDEILQKDGKLASQKALIDAALKRDYELTNENCFFPGHRMDFMYCIEQYGLPLLGKAASKLEAHRINIECFLKYSKSKSEDQELNDYYEVLKECKFSQHCCKLLKKEPSENLQIKLNVDVIIKGLMASESRMRMINASTRGHIFKSSRKHIDGAFYHVSPLAMWTDQDIWNYISFYELEYSPLYDITYEDHNDQTQQIERNGCMFCGTDIIFRNNHLAVLRQTHPKAYKICMEKFGYKKALLTLFRKYNKKGIMEAMTHQGRTARMLFAVGDLEDFSRIRPCAYDEIGDMMELDNTGLTEEYDPEEFEQDDFNDGFDFDDSYSNEENSEPVTLNT